ncbi:hypothetical protein L596_022701 [Steinernema carpocapsae]|uniref:Uncharacterized protein n=1 Tax=Steinernema carpocapsae TaxID=34508 RepID=A0A4U5MNQ9_STECR|nr:hypothetical protein L596_022701 [Steinernema carpocapsae]
MGADGRSIKLMLNKTVFFEGFRNQMKHYKNVSTFQKPFKSVIDPEAVSSGNKKLEVIITDFQVTRGLISFESWTYIILLTLHA